jgi:hypothetical protein
VLWVEDGDIVDRFDAPLLSQEEECEKFVGSWRRRGTCVGEST